MSRPTASELPEPATALEAQLLTVLRAWLSGAYYAVSGYDIMEIMLVAMTAGTPYLVRSNSKLYDYTFKQSREVYELLRPFIRMTKPAEERLLALYAAKNKQEASSA